MPHIDVNEFIYNPDIFTYIDLDSKTEQVICNQIESSGGEFEKNYLPVWAHDSKITCGNYSYIKLLNYLDICRPIEYIVSKLIQKKKLCLIYGNCQVTVLSRLLSSSEKFREQYIIVQLPEIFKAEYYNGYYNIFKEILSKTDLFVYQHVNVGNRFGEEMATDNILKFLKEDCIKICFPNAYVGFYYPQSTKIKGEKIPEDTIMPYGDSAIQNNITSTNYEDLITKITSEDLYSKDHIEKYFAESMNELRQREYYCDVIISDYI